MAVCEGDPLHVEDATSVPTVSECKPASCEQADSTHPDSALLALIHQGDEDAMARLYDCHSTIVYSVALRVLRSTSAAEDVVQDVFLRIWRSPSSFIATRGNLRSWLAIIARNRAIDALRQRRPTDPIEDVPIASAYDLASDVERLVMIERVKIRMAELPLVQREALDMAFFQGCTHAEIVQRTGIPLGTVKTRLRSALQTLSTAFREPTQTEGARP